MPNDLLRTPEPGGVLRLTLHRPDRRNALTGALLDRLRETLTDVRADAGVRLVILDAAGPAFCAGMDLAEMQARAAAPDAEAQWQRDAQAYHDVLVALLDVPCPTVAIVQGPAVAGGLGLVLACDLVLASHDAWFALPEPQRGITAALVTPLLVRRAGAGPAAYLLLSGKRLAAADAHRLGLCHALGAPGDLPSVAADLTNSVLASGPAALAATKQFLRECGNGPALYHELGQAVAHSAAARSTPEAREGLAAFLEKRPPAWRH